MNKAGNYENILTQCHCSALYQCCPSLGPWNKAQLAVAVTMTRSQITEEWTSSISVNISSCRAAHLGSISRLIFKFRDPFQYYWHTPWVTRNSVDTVATGLNILDFILLVCDVMVSWLDYIRDYDEVTSDDIWMTNMRQTWPLRWQRGQVSGETG